MEAKDASEAERLIDICNSGVLAAPASLLFELLDRVEPNNAKKEYYLTDVVGAFVKDGSGVSGHRTADAAACMGCNTREELARLFAEYTRRQTRRCRLDDRANDCMIDQETINVSTPTTSSAPIEYTIPRKLTAVPSWPRASASCWP